MSCPRQDSGLAPGHLSLIGARISSAAPGCARRAVNQAGRAGVLHPSLACMRRMVVVRLKAWGVGVAATASLASASAPLQPLPATRPLQSARMAQLYPPTSPYQYSQPV